MDIISKKKRSWNMSRIKAMNTVPEIKVRSLLHSMGYRFRLHVKKLPGKPDIVLSKYKTAIFVHGCFWHRHKGCKYAYMPKSRATFWQAKFNANIERHKEVEKQIANIGWRSIVIWECELSDSVKLMKKFTNI